MPLLPPHEHEELLRNLAELDTALRTAIAEEASPQALARLYVLLEEVNACREKDRRSA